VNYATAIANQAESPDHVEISKNTYDNLNDDLIFGKSNEQNVDMWKDGFVKWKGDSYNSKITNWYYTSK